MLMEKIKLIINLIIKLILYGNYMINVIVFILHVLFINYTYCINCNYYYFMYLP